MRASRSASPPTWRIVACGQACAQALQPLAEARGAAPHLLWTPAPVGEVDAQVEAFIEAHGPALLESEILLVVGRPPALPFALLHALALTSTVGLLPFDDPQILAAYARRALTPPGEGLGLTTFHVTKDTQTRLVRAALIDPLHERWEQGGWGPRLRFAPGGATRDALTQHLAEGGRRLALVSTHGERPPGGMDTTLPVDQDGRPLRPEDLPPPGAPCLEGGAAILFSCCGGGIPHRRGWARALRIADAPRPPADVPSPLIEALLTHPRGPLAVVAHVDTLTSWGLMGAGRARPEGLESPGIRPFAALAEGLARGRPLFEAFRPLAARRIQAEAAAREALDRARLGEIPDDSDRLRFPLLAWQDWRGWVIYGDPAIRLTRP